MTYAWFRWERLSMNVAAASTYWVIVTLWLVVLGTIIFFYMRNPRMFGTTHLLLAVLTIDAFRNIFENVYFGIYFGSVYGILPSALAGTMGRPILLIDIDHFKAVNDRLGHDAGDRVLQNVAAICRAEKRDSDVVARVGGEEFAIM